MDYPGASRRDGVGAVVSTRRKGPPANGTVLHPMDPASRDEIALAMYAAVSALGHAPSGATIGEVARQLAIMTAAIDTMSNTRIQLRTDAPSRAIVKALTVVETIDKRNDKGQGWSVSAKELGALRECAGAFDMALRSISFAAYDEARNLVDTALARAA